MSAPCLGVVRGVQALTVGHAYGIPLQPIDGAVFIGGQVIVVPVGGTVVSYVSAARERTATVKGTSGSLINFLVELLSGTAVRWIQLHNAAAATPVATGTIVTVIAQIQGGQTFSDDQAIDSTIFTAGIKIALSTTEDTYTNPGADEGRFVAQRI